MCADGVSGLGGQQRRAYGGIDHPPLNRNQTTRPHTPTLSRTAHARRPPTTQNVTSVELTRMEMKRKRERVALHAPSAAAGGHPLARSDEYEQSDGCDVSGTGRGADERKRTPFRLLMRPPTVLVLPATGWECGEEDTGWSDAWRARTTSTQR